MNKEGIGFWDVRLCGLVVVTEVQRLPLDFLTLEMETLRFLGLSAYLYQ